MKWGALASAFLVKKVGEQSSFVIFRGAHSEQRWGLDRKMQSLCPRPLLLSGAPHSLSPSHVHLPSSPVLLHLASLPPLPTGSFLPSLPPGNLLGPRPASLPQHAAIWEKATSEGATCSRTEVYIGFYTNLRHNQHPVQLTHLKCTSHWRIFTELCIYHHNQFYFIF